MIRKCGMKTCDDDYEVMCRNPWGDLILLCKKCVPEFRQMFWPEEEE
jgi:hypothetical protein